MNLSTRAKNLITRLNTIIKHAGQTPWTETFVNLRAIRLTELQPEFPSHVGNAWLGHSAKVAEKHYFQVRGTDWEKATTPPASNSATAGATAKGENGATAGSSSGNRQSSPTVRKSQKSSQNQSKNDETCLPLVTAGGSSENDQHPRQDSNL